jgi:hypothetical protein
MKAAITAVPCIVCRNLVSLAEAKTDELGRTVHEACYFEQLLARQARGAEELKSRERPSSRQDH